jgi:hypothetical protein
VVKQLVLIEYHINFSASLITKNVLGEAIFYPFFQFNKMKKIALTLLVVVFGKTAMAQSGLTSYFYGQDAFKYSQQKIVGTARMQGMGGGFTALGGDASSAFQNPAGLGFYTRSELSFTPVFDGNKVTSNYIGNSSTLSTPESGIGQAAVVFSNKGTGSRKKSSSFAISYSKVVDLRNDFNYAGVNNKSSMIDAFVESTNGRGVESSVLDNEFDTKTSTATSPEALYYWGYLVNPIGGTDYEASELSVPVNQDGRYTETGSVGQWNFSYGANFDDKTYIGASVGIKTLDYRVLGDHQETFPNGQFLNGFDYYDDLVVQGAGMNLSLGAIIKASKNIQFGVNVTTPTAMATQESYFEGVVTNPIDKNLDNFYQKIQTELGGPSLRITTPLRGSIGTTFFLPKKIGFVSADVEYVGYKSMNVKDANDSRWTSDQKRAIQDTYSNVLNFKVGGEVRASKARFRAGVNYLASPYQQPNTVIKDSQLLTSLGLGYRSERFFIDLAGVFNTFESAYTPYTLSNPEFYASSALKTNRNSLVITIGTAF